MKEIGRAVADYLLGTAHSPLQQEEFDAFLFLLRSATSAVGGPIVSRALHSAFIQPLAAHFRNEEAEGRAALVTACVLGFATMRITLNTLALQPAKAGALRVPLAEAIQACVGSGR